MKPARHRETGTGAWSCAACGTALTPVTTRGSLSIGRCGSCGLVIGDDVAAESRPSDVVATAPGHFSLLRDDIERHEAVSADLLARRLGIYEDHLGAPPRHWLEIGPGNGVLATLLQRHDCSWTGVEFDAEMAALMQAEGKAVVQADFASIDPSLLISDAVRAQGGFDVVTFSQVLEHVRRADRFLANALTALRPGGLLHLDVPNDAGLTAAIRRANPFAAGYGEVVPPHHLIAYSPPALRRALDAAGFEIIAIFACRYDHPVFGLAHCRMGASVRMRAVWRLSGLLRRGGNLVALARKPR